METNKRTHVKSLTLVPHVGQEKLNIPANLFVVLDKQIVIVAQVV